ncbi:phosphoribosyltransferase [Streptomyces sp. TP-A0874]|uniref:phosphoribosyltransferase n=1 Tax=Streptomyces sp. TP-A0874 TaxID=549819 RepID=UPI0008532D38|nr:phosphoribosyltransferase family protein [Streptomyces sp. TP-A0874]
MRFRDRRQAGQELADRLREERGRLPDPVVLGLPRGGVPVADEVARALGAPLDVLVSRKIGAPFNPEFGVGAVAGEQPPIYDERSIAALGLSTDQLAAAAEEERAEVRRREALYRRGREAPELRERSVVVVDDGLATGITARAALASVHDRGAARLLLAVPVSAPDTAEAFRNAGEDLVCLYEPQGFTAVGRWYEDFAQVSDDEVVSILMAPRTVS